VVGEIATLEHELRNHSVEARVLVGQLLAGGIGLLAGAKGSVDERTSLQLLQTLCEFEYHSASPEVLGGLGAGGGIEGELDSAGRGAVDGDIKEDDGHGGKLEVEDARKQLIKAAATTIKCT
jgi:hypothetical protein